MSSQDPLSAGSGTSYDDRLALTQRFQDFERRLRAAETQLAGTARAQPFTLPSRPQGQGIPRVSGLALVPKPQMVVVMWTPVTIGNLLVYQVQYADDADFQTNVRVLETTQTMQMLPDVTPTQAVFVRVRALAQIPRGGRLEGPFSLTLSTTSGIITPDDMPEIIIPQTKFDEQDLALKSFVDIPLAQWDPDVQDLEIRLASTGVNTAGAHLDVRLSFDGGLVFVASGYEYHYFTSLAATFPATIATAQAQARLTAGGTGILNARNLFFHMRSGGRKTYDALSLGMFSAHFTLMYAANAGGNTRSEAIGSFTATASGGPLLLTATHLRLSLSAGTFFAGRVQSYVVE